MSLQLPAPAPNSGIVPVHNGTEPPIPAARPLYVGYPDQAMSPGPASRTLLEYWRILRRRKGTLVICAFLGALAAYLFTLPQTPVYQARVSIEIQGMNENFLNMQAVNPTSSASTFYPEYDLQTQVRILQSRTLFDRVRNKLKNGTRRTVVNESRLSAWRNALGLPAFNVVSAPQSADSGCTNLRVRAQTNTRLVDVACDSTDPQLAADFANTLANEFIEQNLEARWQTTQHTGEWLGRQMEEVKVKLEKSEEQLQNYARSTGLMFTAEKDNIAELKLKQLQEELSRAQADRVAKQSRFELATTAAPESLPEVLDSQSLKDYQLKLTDLRRQLAELASSLTAAHPRVQKLEAQISTLTTALQRERSNIVSRIRNDFETAQRRERLLAADYANHSRLMTEQADKVTHYHILKREVDTNRQLFDSMLQRVKEAGIASALRASNVRIVDTAQPSGAPYKPDLHTNAVIGLLGGIFFGIVLVGFRERADRSVQEPGDAAAFAGLPELGVIPAAGTDPADRRRLLPSSPGTSMQLALTSRDRKPSLVAESFRATLTSILFCEENGSRPRVIVLSSASPKEGKTTVASNLAIALAQIRHRVLLIDADLRRPQLHRVFDLANDHGLADLLRNPDSVATPLNGHVRATNVPNLWVLPSGEASQDETSLIYSPHFAALLRQVRQDYETIFIDTPPMLTMADARIIGRLADAVVLVVRANQTSRDALKAAHQRFVEDGTRVLGTVLNDWNPNLTSHYGYYGYYGRYKGYYKKNSDK